MTSEHRSWPPQWRFTVAELRRGSLDMPLVSATASSVWRRAGVVVGCLVAGLATGHLEHGVLAAFGAIQTGLVEAAMPRRSLARLLVLIVTSTIVMAFVGSLLGGTWWAVVVLGAVAFMQGASLGTGTIPNTVFIGALAMGVIFSGQPRSAAAALAAAGWVAVGAISQVAMWAATWRRERRLFVRRALANDLTQLSALLRFDEVNGRDFSMAAAAPDAITELLSHAGLPLRQHQSAEAVAKATGKARRAVVTWMTLRRPGAPPRVALDELVRQCRRSVLSGRPVPVVTADRVGTRSNGAGATGGSAGVEGVGQWQCDIALLAAVSELKSAITDFNAIWHETRKVRQDEAGVAQERFLVPIIAAMRPGGPSFRHGMRMSVAIMIAVALSISITLVHSFWVPLTVVFILKPDWSFTVLRSTTRFLGNLAAVLVVPLLWMWTGQAIWASVALVAITSLLMFRYFTGNYALASFGLAGTVLLLDEALSASLQLYEVRVFATVIGVVIALAVALAIPTWRGVNGWLLLTKAQAGLAVWWTAVRAGLSDPESVSVADIGRLREEVRRDIAAVRPVVEGSVLEPFQARDPRPLVLALAATERAHISMLTLSNQMLWMREWAGERTDQGVMDGTGRDEVPPPQSGIGSAFDAGFERVSAGFHTLDTRRKVAAVEPGGTADDGAPSGVATTTSEAVAVAAEVNHLAATVGEIADMRQWGQQSGVLAEVR